MSRFANLADKPKGLERKGKRTFAYPETATATSASVVTTPIPSSRVGQKAIAGYSLPELSLAMNVCARKNGLSLQARMAAVFDDI